VAGNTAQTIEQTAIELFYANGYHGTSIRDISRAADVGIATLFHHYSSKAELLRGMMERGFDGLLAEMEDAVSDAGDPTERLSAAVRVHVRHHCEKPMESSVAASELRSLEPPALQEIMAKRDRVQALFATAVADGCRTASSTASTPSSLRGPSTRCARAWSLGIGTEPG
jgi:AcrR family transcriptional regulator